jgi:hypothetical protein
MCAGGDLMEKTLSKAVQVLHKISKAATMTTRISLTSDTTTF